MTTRLKAAAKQFVPESLLAQLVDVRERLERRALGRRDPALAEALERTSSATLLPQRRRIVLYREGLAALAACQGDVAEIGVHEGGGIGVLAPSIVRTGRHLHLFDRWGDLPTGTAEDGDVMSRYAEVLEAGREYVRTQNPRAAAERLLLTELSLAPDSVSFHQGWFADTFSTYAGGALCFAHLDADWYESTRLALEFLDQQCSPGATVVVDDFGPEWPGVETAVSEFRARTSRRIDLRAGRGQAVLRLA